MSSRALRKLHGDVDITVPAGLEDCELEEEVTPISKSKIKKNKKKIINIPSNPFDLLEDGEENEFPTADISEEDVDNAEDIQIPIITTTNKQKKKKKKKNKKKIEDEKKEINGKMGDEDEIEASVREVNEMLGVLPSTPSCGSTEAEYTSYEHPLLKIEHKYLDPNQEMRKIFGARVVQTETRLSRGRGKKATKSYWLVKPKDNWLRMARLGLSMTFLESRGKEQYFAFEHSKEYREVQFQFLDAVESLNPQNIVSLLNLNPSHIDSLLQLSEVCKMSEDINMAAELIERALFTFEQNFHTMFNLAQGTCRLDYRRPENRAFYLAIFRHLTFVGQRGCYRTALEFCKLLLSLDPEGDPLCSLLMMDFYALRCEQFDFLIRLYSDWEHERNLSQLPNFALSVPLAMFHAASQQNSDTTQADNLLQEGLMMFPGVLMPLLDKCGISPDQQVAAHAFFTTRPQLGQADALKQLIALYVGRCHSCWKEPDVLAWLETNVRQVLLRVDQNDPFIEKIHDRQKNRYRGMPKNIYRHIIMSEIKDATTALPPELSSTPVMSYDPLPPSDSIVSYTRPTRTRRVETDPNALSMFFRSLLPNFNPQELVDETAGGATGGQPPQGLQQGVGALMEAMRDLLNNIQPVPPPVEEGGNNNNNQADEEERPLEEWD